MDTTAPSVLIFFNSTWDYNPFLVIIPGQPKMGQIYHLWPYVNPFKAELPEFSITCRLCREEVVIPENSIKFAFGS